NGIFDDGDLLFQDLNDNGILDTNEINYDIAEIFRDDNEDGIRQSTEEFFDFNSNGVWDTEDGMFSGVLCESNCAEDTTRGIGTNLVLTLSHGAAYFDRQILDTTGTVIATSL